MKINQKKLNRVFTKIMKEQFGPDGFAEIDKIVVEFLGDTTSICLKGRMGDGSQDETGWQEDFTVEYPDGQSLDFIKGVFYAQTENIY